MIAISGPSGVGKTTYASFISDAFGIPYYEEPADDVPLLYHYYKDPSRWALTSQLNFLTMKVSALTRAPSQSIIDRCLDEDYLFAKINYQLGLMNSLEWDVYHRTFNLLKKEITKPTLLIYLDSSFDTIMTRMKMRGRNMEFQVEETYWRSVYDAYQEWIDSFSDCKILRIDVADYDIIDDPKSQSLLIKRLSPFIKSIERKPV